MTLPRTLEAKGLELVGQMGNDLLVDADRTIFVTDRVRGGLYVYRHAAG